MRNRIEITEEKITLCYDLLQLPTAQHKAGLAGLLLMIASMQQRNLFPLPEVVRLSPDEVTIVLTRESLQVVFDDLFDAEIVETHVNNKWAGNEPKRVVEVMADKESEKEVETRYVYDVLRPKGLFLQELFPEGDETWIELWRRMLWNVLRAQPAARKVYEERCRKEPSSVAEDIFTAFSKEVKQAKKGKKASEGISGSVFIGAQHKNAENVPFTGLPTENFLLHFWHIVTKIFVPRMLSVERGKEEGLRVKWQDIGFALAIPEPAHLENFLHDIRHTFSQLEMKCQGGIPSRAIINFIEEGGLEYFHYLSSNGGNVKSSLYAVEVYHLQKQGNNVRMLTAERIVPTKGTVEKYAQLREERMNLVFNHFYLQNILHGKKWYEGSSRIMSEYPVCFCVYNKRKTPTSMPYFSIDAWKRFFSIEGELRQMTEEDMREKGSQENLLVLGIRNIVRRYIQKRAEKKAQVYVSKLKRDDNGKVIYPACYREAVEKICVDFFLSIRERKGQDFIEYFTETFCSVLQRLSKESFVLISKSLVQECDKVKDITMLAVSACSYLPHYSKDHRG